MPRTVQPTEPETKLLGAQRPPAPRTRGGPPSALLAIALAAGACTPYGAHVRLPAGEPGKRSFTYERSVEVLAFPSGMRVALDPDPNTNMVKVDLRYEVGAAEDPAGKAGLAHLVEHVTFLARQHPDGPTLGDRLGLAALSHNAFTTWDETHYTAAALSDRLDELLAIEAERMQIACDQLDELGFARERQVVLQELAQRNTPAARIQDELRGTIFGPDHPYARRVIGTATEVGTLGREDVCEFLDHHYAPSRAVLVVSGHFDREAALAAITRHFGPIARAATGSRAPIAPLRLTGKTSRYARDVEEPIALVFFPEPPFGQAGSMHARVLNTLLAERLYELERSHRFITDSAVGRLGGQRAGAAVFVLSVAEPRQLERAVELLARERRHLLGALDDEKLSVIKTRLLALMLLDLEPFARRAWTVADYLQHTTHGQLMWRDLTELWRTKVADLERYARSHLRPERSHVVYLEPAGRSGRRATRDELAFTTREFDVRTWEGPVDPADARRPLALPGARPLTSVRAFELSNGLHVLLAPELAHPVVDIRVVFPAGRVHDPAELPGLAELAATLLADDYSRPFRWEAYWMVREALRLSWQPSGHARSSATVFRLTGLSMYADRLLWRLHWRLESGAYNSEDLKEARTRARRPRDPARHARAQRWRHLREALYGAGHPFAAPPPTPEVLDRISRTDLERFRRRHYVIRGATLIVTGRFDADAVEREIRHLFGRWDNRTGVVEAPIAPARLSGRARYLAFESDQRAQIELTVAFPADPGVEAYPARLVLEQMLAQRMNAVRERLGASYGVDVTYTTRDGPGALYISGHVAADQAAAALAAIRAGIDDLRRADGFDADFVRARRKVLERALASALDSRSLADELTRLTTLGLDPEFLDRLPAQIATLEPAAVMALVAVELGPDRELVMASGALPRVQAMYRQTGLGPVEVVR